jgi:Na+-transporting NADH:ubiquinone oxidoreductase subunit D
MSTTSDTSGTLSRPLLAENPITFQILGICSALAVTRTVETALAMSISVVIVLVGSSAAISLIRNEVPRSVRLIVQITLIATFVIIVDQVLQAFFWELSRELSVFVGLIITNCVILGRAETFAMRHGVGASIVDALGNGLGYGLVLLIVGAIRELLGTGRLLGVEVLPLVEQGGWFEPIGLMLRPPSAFFLIGGLVWASRSWSLRSARASQGAVAHAPLVEERA